MRENGNTQNKSKPSDWPRQDLRYMKGLIKEFERHLLREGRFPGTIRKYLKDTRQFFRERAISAAINITRESINDWILTLRERGCATGTIANHLWAIKAFLYFLKTDKGICFYEFDIRIPRVKAPDVVEFLETEELEKLFSVLDVNTLQGLRLRTLIEVMVNTGLRPTEALTLKREDVMLAPEEIEIIGKGGKRRAIYFNLNTHNWIGKYIRMRNDNKPFLFVTHDKTKTLRPLNLRQAQYIFQQAIKASGINKRIVLHTLRHTYATHLMANGCAPDFVARLLGHSSVKTTRRHYLAVVQKHAKAAHFRYLSFNNNNNPTIAPNPFIERPSYAG